MSFQGSEFNSTTGFDRLTQKMKQSKQSLTDYIEFVKKRSVNFPFWSLAYWLYIEFFRKSQEMIKFPTEFNIPSFGTAVPNIFIWSFYLQQPITAGVIKQIVNFINKTDRVVTLCGSKKLDLGA